MTQRLILTADAARRIVESGSETVLCDLQRIDPPRHVPPARASWRCRFTNEGRWPIEPGEMVGITGMADSVLSTAEAVENWRRDGLRLRVKRIGLIDDANAAWLARGIALDAVPAGGAGRGAARDLFAGIPPCERTFRRRFRADLEKPHDVRRRVGGGQGQVKVNLRDLQVRDTAENRAVRGTETAPVRPVAGGDD